DSVQTFTFGACRPFFAPGIQACFYSLSAPAWTILKSSILWPVLRATTSQRGVLPRPDQVSEGDNGLRYLGSTLGYLRRGERPATTAADSLDSFFSPAISLRLSCSRRFSNSRFSAKIRFASILAISSWRRQSSLNCISSRSFFRMGNLVIVAVPLASKHAIPENAYFSTAVKLILSRLTTR